MWFSHFGEIITLKHIKQEKNYFDFCFLVKPTITINKVTIEKNKVFSTFVVFAGFPIIYSFITPKITTIVIMERIIYKYFFAMGNTN